MRVLTPILVALTASVLLVANVALGQQKVQEQLDKVSFPTSCNRKVQPEFDRAVAMLHSFWFQQGEKAFREILERDPSCAIANWGIAMNALGNPFAWPPSAKGLADGLVAIERAATPSAQTPRERDYIAALDIMYRDNDKVDHRTRAEA